jgi:hypothetical protein
MPAPIPFDNTYARLSERFYSKQSAAAVPAPRKRGRSYEIMFSAFPRYPSRRFLKPHALKYV